MKKDNSLKKWDMGWVSQIEWNRICEIKKSRVVEIVRSTGYVRLSKGLEFAKVIKARGYWMDRLEAITVRLPGHGYNSRVERIYPKMQKVIQSNHLGGKDWSILITCGHGAWLESDRDPNGKSVMCPVKDCIPSRYPQGRLNEKE